MNDVSFIIYIITGSRLDISVFMQVIFPILG